jgi:hypothetical protein
MKGLADATQNKKGGQKAAYFTLPASHGPGVMSKNCLSFFLRMPPRASWFVGRHDGGENRLEDNLFPKTGSRVTTIG